MTVTAVNKVGLTSTAFSKPLVVDNTPPQVCQRTSILFTENCHGSGLVGVYIMLQLSSREETATTVSWVLVNN